MKMGHIKSAMGVSWLCVVACGGISEQRGTDGMGGTGSGGSAHHPVGQGGSGNRASGGSAPAAGGAAVSVGGSTGIGGATMTEPVASGAACYNDIDCPGNACGAEVCNWTRVAAKPVGDKIFYCNAAGTQPRGADGWCTTDADCKCRALGAKCVAPYCSFTRAQDAPGR